MSFCAPLKSSGKTGHGFIRCQFIVMLMGSDPTGVTVNVFKYSLFRLDK